MKITLGTIAFVITVFFTCSPLQAEQNCDEILETTCTICHFKDRICKKVGKKSKRSWKNTTKRMIRYGLKIDKSGVNTVTKCLVSIEEGPGEFCK